MTWHLFGHISDIDQENGYLCMPVGDQEVVLLKDEAGQPWAFDNLCPHRGARIFMPGRNAGKPICAYHGRHVSPFTPGVNKLPVHEICGWILVGTHPSDVRELPDWVGAIAKLGDQRDLKVANVMQMVYPCHWTVAVENALDFDHVATVHEGTLDKLKMKSTFRGFYEQGGSVEMFEATEKKQIDEMVKHFDRASLVDYVHLFAPPFACLATTRGATFSLQTYMPMPDGSTYFVSRLFARPTTSKYGEVVLDAISAFNQKVFQEDAQICSRVKAGYPGTLSKTERRIGHFRAAMPPA